MLRFTLIYVLIPRILHKLVWNLWFNEWGRARVQIISPFSLCTHDQTLKFITCAHAQAPSRKKKILIHSNTYDLWRPRYDATRSCSGHLTLKSPQRVWVLISPHNISLESNVKVIRKMETIINLRSSQLADKFSLSLP